MTLDTVDNLLKWRILPSLPHFLLLFCFQYYCECKPKNEKRGRLGTRLHSRVSVEHISILWFTYHTWSNWTIAGAGNGFSTDFLYTIYSVTNPHWVYPRKDSETKTTALAVVWKIKYTETIKYRTKTVSLPDFTTCSIFYSSDEENPGDQCSRQKLF